MKIDNMRRIFLHVLFWVFLLIAIAMTGLFLWMLGMGIRDEIRYGSPDNLGFGIAFVFFIIGSPFGIGAFLLHKKLKAD